jgi:beta-lactamase regulating signal transducer with metallopeptidase domain
MALVPWVLALALRSTVVLGVALALGRVPRLSAVARHRLLTFTAASLLLLPALSGLLPRWELRVPRVPSGGGASILGSAPVEAPPVARAGRVEASFPEALPPRPPRTRSTSLPASVGLATFGLWLTGVLVSLLGLFRGLRRERRLVSASHPLVGAWLETLDAVRGSLGVSWDVRLLTGDGIDAPATCGWRRPAVLVPRTATGWPDERRRVVLQHELVHVLRGDALRRLAWRVVVALYWFHPLARLAEREARAVGEHACDETVLDLGTRPSAYARHLLEIAESLRDEPRFLATALPMADRGQLERRLLMILDRHRPTGRGRAAAFVSLALLAGTVAAVAAAVPSADAVSPPGGAAPARAAAPAMASKPEQVAKPAVAAKPARAAVVSEDPSSVCLDRMRGSFSGTVNEGRSIERSDDESGDFMLQQDLGDGRLLCARVKGKVRFDERTGAIREMPSGGSLSVETRGRKGSERVRVTAGPAEPRYEWWLDGASRTPDDAARAWLASALEAVAGFRAIGEIQGRVGGLQGEIGGIQGEVGGLQGEIGGIQGEIGGLQGNVGSIQGERGGLQGEIGGHQGAIGGLEAGRWQANAAERARIDEAIATHRAAIRKLEAEMESRQFDRRITDAEAELRKAEAKGRDDIAALQRKIEDVHAEERIGGLERQIADLHAEDRIAEIERRMAPALDRLKASIDRTGR